MRASIIVTFLSGLYFVLYFLFPEKLLIQLGVIALHPTITQCYIVVGTMAFGVGLINLFMAHIEIIARLRKGLFFSCILLFGMIATLTFGLTDWYYNQKIEKYFRSVAAYQAYYEKHSEVLSEHDKQLFSELMNSPQSIAPLVDGKDAAQFLKNELIKKEVVLNTYQSESLSAKASQFFNDGVFVPLGSSMFALLSFYIASAAFRAFRFRSIEAGLLMGAALFVVFGQVSFISSLWSGFPTIRNWLLTTPNTASFRGISLGASVAGLVLSIRIWLSLDRNQSGQE